ncbi:DNA alkylation repair protein [Roseivirga pacifica]|uniref:DNA alkylation repair protein n=1 Tax=Roseivirga pacifica TaxID=1267423 RepID=UPI00227C8098|nr:DNA alkylation repair protein [Roseivirga pacifica]
MKPASIAIFELVKTTLHEHKNEENARAMEAYIKHLFPFLGIKAPIRKEAVKSILAELKREKKVDWDFVDLCYQQPEREFHYTACDHIRSCQRYLKQGEIEQLKKLITTHAWWETVDTLAVEVGAIAAKFPTVKPSHIQQWITHEHMWLRRVSILFQMRQKEKTDTAFLTNAIESNLDSKEFFINKAIGWALRSYGDTNPEWVIEFCDNHALAALSRKEALRKIV